MIKTLTPSPACQVPDQKPIDRGFEVIVGTRRRFGKVIREQKLNNVHPYGSTSDCGHLEKPMLPAAADDDFMA
jgi:hypothetical protein